MKESQIDMQPLIAMSQMLQKRSRDQRTDILNAYEAGDTSGRQNFNKDGYGCSASIPLWKLGVSSNSTIVS